MACTGKILIVEDEIVSGILLQKFLTGHGFAVTALVASGEEAVESARLNRPDVVLMDIQLAGEMNGIDAAVRIKTYDDIPVIFITGYDEPIIRDRAMTLAPAAYFQKPCNMPALLATIREIAGG